MHGFFILPPERNRQEANNIALVLNKIISSGLFEFEFEANFDFISRENNLIYFNHNFDVINWKNYQKCHDFGILTKYIEFF